MIRYILSKLFWSIPLVLAVVTLIFFLIELSPGDVSDRFLTPETPPEVRQLIIQKYGLDQPAATRWVLMIRNVLTGDLGVSVTTERPVIEMIWDSLPNTLLLSVVTLMVINVVGLSLGLIQAVRQYTALDTGISVVSLFFYAMPSFWLALMLQLFFSLYLPVLPSSGIKDPVMFQFMGPMEQIIDVARHILLPGVALGLASSAYMARYMRSSVLEVIRQDYVRTARAKGLPEWRVIGQHALRNALGPFVNLLGLQLPALISGSVLVENIFAWPGMGRLIVNAIFQQDTPVIIGCFIFFTLLVVLGNLLADVVNATLDPRIRLS